MTSNRSFFKLQLELIKRNLILPVLSGVGFFFVLPLFTLMSIQNRLDNIFGDTPENIKKSLSNMAKQYLISDSNDGVKFGIIIMAILSAFMIFKYLHNRKQVDFFHSLPISRGNLFIQLYLTGFMSVIPLYIIMYLLAVICAFVMGAGAYITVGLIFKTIIINTLFFLLFYSLGVLAVILSGNTFISFLIYVLFNFGFIVTLNLFINLCSEWFETFASGVGLAVLGENLTPLWVYLSGGVVFSYSDCKSTKMLIGVLAAVIIISILSYILFKIRKSERAGSALSFYQIKAPLKCYLSLICGYVFMFIFMGIAGYSWRYIGIFFGVVLSHMVFEALYNFEIRSLFKNWKTMIALFVFSIVFFLGMKVDIIGYDTKIPNEADVTGVSISANYPNSEAYRTSTSTFNAMSDAKNISTVLQIAQYAVDNLDTSLDDADAYYYFDVTYELKNGKTMSRHYGSVPVSDEYKDWIESIIFSEDFIKNQEYSIFDIELDRVNSIQMDIRTQAASSNYISGTVINTNHAIEIIKTLREESLTLTKEQAQTTAPALRIDMDFNYSIGDDGVVLGTSYGGYLEFIPVYPTYTKTLALISKYANVQPKSLSADDISSLEVYIHDDLDEDIGEDMGLDKQTIEKLNKLVPQDDGSYAIVVTDKQTISKIIENAMIYLVASSASPVFEIERTYPFEVMAVYDDNDRQSLLYPAGKADYQLIASTLTHLTQ